MTSQREPRDRRDGPLGRGELDTRLVDVERSPNRATSASAFRRLGLRPAANASRIVRVRLEVEVLHGTELVHHPEILVNEVQLSTAQEMVLPSCWWMLAKSLDQRRLADLFWPRTAHTSPALIEMETSSSTRLGPKVLDRPSTVTSVVLAWLTGCPDLREPVRRNWNALKPFAGSNVTSFCSRT